MIEIVRLQNVYLVAPDMAASTHFYAQCFGLEARFSDANRWTQYGIAGAGFALASAQEAASGATGAVPVFEVANFDGVEASIMAAGGQVGQLRDMGAHGRVLSVLDPAGNVIQLFCRSLED